MILELEQCLAPGLEQMRLRLQLELGLETLQFEQRALQLESEQVTLLVEKLTPEAEQMAPWQGLGQELGQELGLGLGLGFEIHLVELEQALESEFEHVAVESYCTVPEIDGLEEVCVSECHHS